MFAGAMVTHGSLLQAGREVKDFVSFIKKNATNKPVVVSGEEEKKKKQEL